MAGPNAERVIETQTFPVYYPGTGRFEDANSDASGALGSTAVVTITLNTRPHMIVGARVRNVYQPPDADEVVDFGPLFQTWRDLKLLDMEQRMTLDLAQQNIIIKAASQGLIVGERGTLWHPFACPYPFRGGNNISLTFLRTVGYPLNAQGEEVIFPTVEVVLFGYAFVKGNIPPGSPPSSEYPEDQDPD